MPERGGSSRKRRLFAQRCVDDANKRRHLPGNLAASSGSSEAVPASCVCPFFFILENKNDNNNLVCAPLVGRTNFSSLLVCRARGDAAAAKAPLLFCSRLGPGFAGTVKSLFFSPEPVHNDVRGPCLRFFFVFFCACVLVCVCLSRPHTFLKGKKKKKPEREVRWQRSQCLHAVRLADPSRATEAQPLISPLSHESLLAAPGVSSQRSSRRLSHRRSRIVKPRAKAPVFRHPALSGVL